jgi:hypothetical protein
VGDDRLLLPLWGAAGNDERGFQRSPERLQVSVQHQAEEPQGDQNGAEKERESHAQKYAHRAMAFFCGLL